MAAVGDILAEWALENGRGDARMTIVGKRDDPGFHLLGEVLQRWQTYPVGDAGGRHTRGRGIPD